MTRITVGVKQPVAADTGKSLPMNGYAISSVSIYVTRFSIAWEQYHLNNPFGTASMIRRFAKST